MTSAQAAGFATIVVASAVVFLLVIMGVPLAARLLFRKRVEIIRDDCVDAIFNDKLRETKSVERFLLTAEAGAELACHLTLPLVFAIARAAVDLGVYPEIVASQPKFADLRPGERELMLELDARLCSAYISYLTWGSPAALVLRPLIVLASRVRRDSGMAKEIGKADDVMPGVARETLRAGTAQGSLLVPGWLVIAGNHQRSTS